MSWCPADGGGEETRTIILHKESDVFAKLINTMINLAERKTDQSYYWSA